MIAQICGPIMNYGLLGFQAQNGVRYYEKSFVHDFMRRSSLDLMHRRLRCVEGAHADEEKSFGDGFCLCASLE